MKRVISLLLVLVLILSMVACGNKGIIASNGNNEANATNNTGDAAEVAESDTGIEATISVQVETAWLDYYESVKARVLEANPNAAINFIETGSFDHLDVLDATDVTNSDVADVFAIPLDRIYGLAQNEALATIDAASMAAHVGGFADYDAGLGGFLNVDGDYLAFPMNIETLIIFANKANAEANGIDLTSTIEFTDLNAEDMLVPAFNAWFGVALTNAADIEFLEKTDDGLFSDLTKEFSDLTQEQQDNFTALYDYWKAHTEAGTDAWDGSAVWGYMDSAFSTGGNTSLRLEGPWSTNSLSTLAGEGADLEILPINQVTINGTPLTHWKGGWGLAVNARIEGKDAEMLLAQAFIEELVNTDYAVDFFKATGKILENVDASVYADSDLPDVDKKVVAAVIESYQDAPARPLFTEWGAVWDTWQNSLLSWSAVKPATVEEAYAEVKASFDAMMLNF